MKNKNMKRIGLTLLLAPWAIACSSDYLDVPLQGKPTAASDPNFAQNLVIGVYNSLMSGESFGSAGDAHGFAFITATNILSDDAEKGSTPGDQAGTVGVFDNFSLTPTNVFVEALWAGYFNGIAKTNQALQAIEQSNLNTNTKNRLAGEVRVIRAYYYFNLVRWFGGVPRITRVPTNVQDANTEPAFKTRASEEEIYQLIQEDLRFGVENLPLRNQTQAGRMSKGTAQALLAKVSMYRKDWTTAAAQAQEVIQSGQYRLLEDYSQIWRQAGDNSSEAIFEIQTGQFNNSDFGINAYSMCQGPRVGGRGGWTDLGWGFGTPSQSLADAYEPGDIRKNSTIIFIDNSGKFKGTILFDGFRIPSADSVENLRYNYKAYHSENRNVESYLGNRDRKQKNVHLLRLGELYLIQAEAALELNQFGEAENALNIVRKRAGLAPVSGLGKDQLREAIWKERRVELAMEHDRFFDLVRQGRAASVLQAQGKNFVAGKHEKLPVPAVQIALSGGTLTQNPGY